MDSLTSAAASGMRSRLESLEMLANNIANASTAGFKADGEFRGLYTSIEAAEAAQSGFSPRADAYPVIDSQWTDLSQGTVMPTGNPLDLALEGPGFFVVDTKTGPLLTRNGSFRVAPDGTITSPEGHPLRTIGGKTLRIDSNRPFVVSPVGTVVQDGQEIGKLELVDPGSSASIRRRGHNYFQLTDPKGALKTADAARVNQGRLEAANVSPAQAAVRLVEVLRQFEMLQKALTIGGEMNRRGIEEVTRVST
jgi:flagellar basal-body rod protein FlgF